MLTLPPDTLHVKKAMSAWRAEHSLVDKLLDLYEKDPALAGTLAQYITNYYGWETAEDVATWPKQTPLAP